MRAYGRECQNFYAYFIQFSSLLLTHLSSDNNFRVSQGALQALDSTVVLFGDHFNTVLVPFVVEHLGDAKQPVLDAARRFLFTLAHAGLFSVRDSSLMLGVTRAGFGGSPTSDAFGFFDLG